MADQRKNDIRTLTRYLSVLPQTVCDYLNYLSAAKNRSVETVIEYARNINEFLIYYGSEHQLYSEEKPELKLITDEILKSITSVDAYAYLAYCGSVKRNSAATRARKTVVIRQFYKYLTYHKMFFKENPMAGLELPKQSKKLPKFLTLEQSLNLLDCVDGKNQERDYAILTLFLNCGLRLAELVSLNYTDIKSDNSMVITGKGNKQRVVYLNDACKAAVDRYMQVRPKDGVIDKTALFLSNRRSRISPKTVQHIVYVFLDKSGLGAQGLSVHKLRHTAATLMYRYGQVDVRTLKDVLGHESLDTTAIYTHVVAEQIKEAVDKNPLSGKKHDE